MFNGTVELRRLNKIEWRLLTDITYRNSDVFVNAKAGLITDGASIPKYLWGIVGSPFTGRYTRPALIHDALYASERLSRKDCDNLFLEMMEADGVSWLKRYSMYLAVRAGGMFVWKKHTQATINEAKKYCQARRLK